MASRLFFLISAAFGLSPLAHRPLSSAYPFAGPDFIPAMIAGVAWLYEDIGPVRVAGPLPGAHGYVPEARSA